MRPDGLSFDAFMRAVTWYMTHPKPPAIGWPAWQAKARQAWLDKHARAGAKSGPK